ncbi:hypothetical protein EDB89DRAFT_1903431 [Lactarius sanguifluus]|nr:hypothetical protein EDB89DRAFT_1903431 [Lactarius sanguifluus]
MRAEGHTTHRKGAREGTRPPGPPFPRDRTVLYAREWGTRGAPPPPLPLGLPEGRARDHGPTLPPCAQRGTPRTGRVHARARDPRPIPSPVTAPPRTRGKGVRRGTPPRSHPSAFGGKRTPLARRPVYATPRPTLPRRAAHAERGTRGQAAPGWWPRSCGKGPASPRVAQRGRRGLGAPAFTAPAPRFSRAMVRLSQKKWM